MESRKRSLEPLPSLACLIQIRVMPLELSLSPFEPNTAKRQHKFLLTLISLHIADACVTRNCFFYYLQRDDLPLLKLGLSITAMTV